MQVERISGAHRAQGLPVDTLVIAIPVKRETQMVEAHTDSHSNQNYYCSPQKHSLPIGIWSGPLCPGCRNIVFRRANRHVLYLLNKNNFGLIRQVATPCSLIASHCW